MTSEEWSLKGKRCFIAVDSIDGVFLVTEKRMKQGDDATFVYKENDIETLRQKLIEDLKQYEKENIDTVRQSRLFAVMLNDIVEIINKRFGVNK